MERTPLVPIPPTRSPSVLKVVVCIFVAVVIFLVGADELGGWEVNILKAAHANGVVLATVLYLATLVVLLVCLVLILMRVLKRR
jgi:hypothetical protein